VLVAALFALIGYYIHRHEPQIARDLKRISALCGLVVAIVDLALLRVLAAGIIRDALGVLPLPARPAAAIRRLLRLDLEPA